MCVSLLCSLPDSWDGLVIAIRSNNTTLKIDDVVASILLEEMRRKNKEGSTHNALIVRGRPIDKGKGKSSSRRKKSRGKSKSRSKSPDKSRRRCWGCSELALVQKRGFFHGGFPRFLLFGYKILCNMKAPLLYPRLV